MPSETPMVSTRDIKTEEISLKGRDRDWIDTVSRSETETETTNSECHLTRMRPTMRLVSLNKQDRESHFLWFPTRYSFSSWMSLYWSVDLQIYRCTDQGYQVNEDLLIIYIVLTVKWSVHLYYSNLYWSGVDNSKKIYWSEQKTKCRSTDHEYVDLNMCWYLLFFSVYCLDPESLIFDSVLIMNICSKKCVLTIACRWKDSWHLSYFDAP